jgi:hypothetical protein
MNSCSEIGRDEITVDKQDISKNKIDSTQLEIDIKIIEAYNDTMMLSSQILVNNKVYLEEILNYFHALGQTGIDSFKYNLQTPKSTQRIIIGDEIIRTYFSGDYSRYIAEKNYNFDGLTEAEKFQSPKFQKVRFKFIDIDRNSYYSKLKTNLDYPNFDYVLYLSKKYGNYMYTRLIPREYHEKQETRGFLSLKYNAAHIFIFEFAKNREIIDVYQSWVNIE